MFTRKEINQINMLLQGKTDINDTISKFQNDFFKTNGFRILKRDVIANGISAVGINNMNDYQEMIKTHKMGAVIEIAIRNYIKGVYNEWRKD